MKGEESSRIRSGALAGTDREKTQTNLLLEKLVQLLGTVLEPAAVCRVDDPDQGVGLLIVVAPVRPDGLLATHVPDVQDEVQEGQADDVESQRRTDRVDILAVEFLHRGRLPLCVKEAHQQIRLERIEGFAGETRERESENK